MTRRAWQAALIAVATAGCGTDQHHSASAPDSFSELLGAQVVASADGGAYAYSEFRGGIWYLRNGEAIRVREVQQLSTATAVALTPLERALWAQLQAEISKRKKAQAETESTQSAQSRDD